MNKQISNESMDCLFVTFIRDHVCLIPQLVFVNIFDT